MKVKIIILASIFLLAVFSFNGYSAQSPRPEDVQQAIARGETRKFLADMEIKAVEAENSRNWALAASLYNEASLAAAISGQLQKAVSYSSKALQFAETAKDVNLQVRAVYLLASALQRLRQHEKAAEWTKRGLELAKNMSAGPLRDRYESSFYRNLGTDFLRNGEHQKAIEYLSHSVQINDSFLGYLTRGSRQLYPGQLDGAVHAVVLSLTGLSRAYERVGNVEEAIKTNQRGVDLISKFQVKFPSEGNLYIGLGRLYLSQRDFPRALENLQRALALAEKQQAASRVTDASVLIGDVLRRTGKATEAIPYYQRAIQLTESTRSLLQSQDYRQSFFEGGLSAYTRMINALLASGKPQEAFNYSERARSRSFLDVLGSKAHLARSGTLLEHERALQARISVLRATVEGEDADAAQTAELRNQLADAERAYNDYLAKVRNENKEQASLMSVEPLTLKEVQDRLDSGVTMLEYFVANDNVWLWVVEKDRVEFVSTTIARKDLVSKITGLRDTIFQFGEKERFNALSQELHRVLIQPALPHIQGKELIVVPHDVLHYLPFQALQSPDGRYLIERYPIYYLSSASLMQFTQEKRRAMGDKVLAFGNPDLDDPKMALQFAEVEAGEIKKLYPQSTLLLKKEATEEKAKTLSPQNGIIHFASNAELNEDDPLASAILLTKSDKEDGRLEVREIFGMNLKASLVVLSACETGLGKLSSGDELVGLTRAFIYAGTPSVVASLWNVEDSSTAQLMASFYKNLKTVTKVEALRQAQLNLIRGNVNSDLLARRGIGGVGKLGEVPAPKSLSQDSISVSTSHPYFWAPFILVGDGK